MNFFIKKIASIKPCTAMTETIAVEPLDLGFAVGSFSRTYLARRLRVLE